MIYEKIFAVLNLLKSLGGVLKDAFLGIFLYRAGQNKVKKERLEEEVKDAKQANAINNNISTSSRKSLRDILRGNAKNE